MYLFLDSITFISPFSFCQRLIKMVRNSQLSVNPASQQPEAPVVQSRPIWLPEPEVYHQEIQNIKEELTKKQGVGKPGPCFPFAVTMSFLSTASSMNCETRSPALVNEIPLFGLSSKPSSHMFQPGPQRGYKQAWKLKPFINLYDLGIFKKSRTSTFFGDYIKKLIGPRKPIGEDQKPLQGLNLIRLYGY